MAALQFWIPPFHRDSASGLFTSFSRPRKGYAYYLPKRWSGVEHLEKFHQSKKLLAILPVAVLSLFAFSAIPTAFASGPTEAIPPNPCSSSGTLVLSLSYHAINDEDSGFVGYWALDHYSKSIQVYNTGGDSYCAWETYDGGWQTFQGALSPQNGVTESRNASGNLNGYLEVTFTATSVTAGTFHISTQNYGGTVSDILLGSYGNGQTGDTSAYSWTANWTSGFTIGSEPIWGFFYFTGNTLAWTNSYNSNTGDIVV